MNARLRKFMSSDPVNSRVTRFTHMVFSSLLFCSLLTMTMNSAGHGSVVAEADLCIIRIGYYQAHFKIYLPESRGLKQYCEDLPKAGEAVFIMEYIHGALGDTPMEFRVIRNVTGQGNYASPQDVDRIENLDDVTVFYMPFALHTSVFTAMHEFSETGAYLGIITARDASGNQYSSVFPFEVGYTRFGFLPLFVLLLAVAQLLYWLLRHRYTNRGEDDVAP